MTETPLHLRRGRRGVPAPIERAINGALSRGPGYEPTPIGTAFDDRSVRGYYIDFSAKTTAASAADPGGLPATPLIQLALGWWERKLAGDPAARGEFLALCEAIEARGEPAGDELHWPTNVAVPKYGLVPPWSSALTQGQAASAFVRAHLETGDDRWAELAARALEPLLDDESALVTATPDGPLLEEAPSDPPAHILNGWMSALWGLWDARLGLGDDRAGEAFAGGVRCLEGRLPDYDTGWWSLYSVYPHRLRDLAKPIYHRFHVAQLEVYVRLTGAPAFRDAAERWAGYDRTAARVRALGQKAAFTAVELPRRRAARRAGAAASPARSG